MIASGPLLLVGVIFTFVGLPFVIVFPIVGVAADELLFVLIGGGLGGLFTVLGLVLAVFGFRSLNQKLRAFQFGAATLGEIVDVYRDTSIRVNGRSPWAIVYRFHVLGQTYEGTARTMDTSAGERQPGQPVHVLYVREDPQQNTLYPPLR